MGVELGIGESLLVKAIAESTGRKPKEVQTDLKKEGDLGLVAMVHATGFHWARQLLMYQISPEFEKLAASSLQTKATHRPLRVFEA